MAAAVQTQALTKSYGALIAVNDLSLEVREGEVFGVLGPNGAGKTTLISMMCGLLRPDSGQVLLHGKRLTRWDAADRGRVGVCPQSIVLWGQLTCLEQLMFVAGMYGIPQEMARQRAERLLEDLDLIEKCSSLARTLSGGMQRRLNLAMALVHDPDILVLDEAEAGLDPQSRVLVREYLKSLAKRKTIILTTHNMDEADRMADRVAIMDHGTLLRVDTPDELKRSVGDGDVLEIETVEVLTEETLSPLSRIAAKVSASDHTVILRAGGAATLLPAILQVLGATAVHPREVRLRANSLEDVFISLTGRRLRE